MSRSAQNKALEPEESACAVCGVKGGHAPGCWVGAASIEAPAPAEEPKETTEPEDKEDE